MLNLSLGSLGKTKFANLDRQLGILSSYIAASHSTRPAASLMTVLETTLPWIENQFTRSGRPKNWSVHTLRAYIQLLKLYSLVLHRAGNCIECCPLIFRWFGDGSASRLLEASAFQLMLERTEGLTPEEGLRGQLVLWEFFQGLVEAVKLHTRRATSAPEGDMVYGAAGVLCKVGHLNLPVCCDEPLPLYFDAPFSEGSVRFE